MQKRAGTLSEHEDDVLCYLGRCTELMRQRIQALPEFKKINSKLTHCHSLT